MDELVDAYGFASDRDGLVDGSFDACAGCVLGSPLLVALLKAGMIEDFLQLAGLQGEGPAAGLRAGALVAHRAMAACLFVEVDDDGLGTALGGGAPPGAGVPGGQVTCLLSQSMVNAVRSKPALARAWGELFIRTGVTK